MRYNVHGQAGGGKEWGAGVCAAAMRGGREEIRVRGRDSEGRDSEEGTKEGGREGVPKGGR